MQIDCTICLSNARDCWIALTIFSYYQCTKLFIDMYGLTISSYFTIYNTDMDILHVHYSHSKNIQLTVNGQFIQVKSAKLRALKNHYSYFRNDGYSMWLKDTNRMYTLILPMHKTVDEYVVLTIFTNIHTQSFFNHK